MYAVRIGTAWAVLDSEARKIQANQNCGTFFKSYDLATKVKNELIRQFPSVRDAIWMVELEVTKEGA